MSSTKWPLHLFTWISNKFLQLNVSKVETLIPLYHTLCFRPTQLLNPPFFAFSPSAHSLASTMSSALHFSLSPCSFHPLSSHYQPLRPASSLVSSPLLHLPSPNSGVHSPCSNQRNFSKTNYQITLLPSAIRKYTDLSLSPQ